MAAPPVQLGCVLFSASPPGPRYPVGQPGTGSWNVSPVWSATRAAITANCQPEVDMSNNREESRPCDADDGYSRGRRRDSTRPTTWGGETQDIALSVALTMHITQWATGVNIFK